MFHLNKQSSLVVFMISVFNSQHIHGYHLTNFIALTIAVWASLTSSVNCQNAPLHHPPMRITARSMVNPYARMDLPDHQPKMMAADTTRYQVLDEFGKETTVPFEGGLLNITNCNGEYYDGWEFFNLTKNLMLIPGDTNKITKTGNIIVVYCTATSSTLKIPSGSVSRIAGSPDQCVNNVLCGNPTEPCPPDICMGNRSRGYTECVQFTKHKYDNYTGMAHTTMPYIGRAALCPLDPVDITYSKNNGTKIPLMPGTLMIEKIGDGGVRLYVKHKHPLSFICNMVTKKNLYEYKVNGTEEVTINPEHQLMVDGIVRVDCHIFLADGRDNPTTYFFIADGELKVDEKCKDGKLSCSVPAWIHEYTNPVINYGTEEGVTCTAQFTICFPTIITEIISTNVSGPNCTDTETEIETDPMDAVGRATAGFVLAIALAVVLLMLCFTIILGIAYWFGSSNRARTLSEIPVNETLKDEEEKKVSGSVNAVGHMDDIITPDKNAAMANAPLEEALKDNDKSVSVADAHNDKEDMVTARDTV